MKLFLSIVLGVLAALFAAVLVAALTSGPEGASALSLSSGKVPIAVAAREMSAGHTLQKDDIKMQSVPRQFAVSEGLGGSESVLGHVLVQPVVPGQAIATRSLAGAGTGPEIEAMLEGGYRATTLTLTDRGPGTFVYPGSYVDVLAIFQMPAGTPDEGEVVSRTVLEGVRVLAVEGYSDAAKLLAAGEEVRSNRGSSRGPVITLLLTPTQAQVLQLARNLGTVSVTLRSNEDDRRVPPTTVSLKQLLDYQPLKPQSPVVIRRSADSESPKSDNDKAAAGGNQEEPAVLAEEIREEEIAETGRPWTTVVIRNGSRSTYQFEESE